MSKLSLLPHDENLGNLPTSELWARAAAAVCPISSLGLRRSRLQALIFCTWDRAHVAMKEARRVSAAGDKRRTATY